MSLPGKGTTFCVVFPVPAAEEGAIIRSAPSVPIGQSPLIPLAKEEYRDDRYTILIVEDNAETLAFLQKSMMERYNVFTAANGKKALKKLRYVPAPHIVISDIMMDEMDGYALYDAMSREEDWSGIPFVFLTAKSTREEKIEGFRRGAVHYVPKPFDIEEVAAAVESLLDFLRKKIEREKKLIREKILQGLAAREPGDGDGVPGSRAALSRREREITAFILKGYQNKEISDCLEISTRTVDKHIEHIYRKYNVANRVELVRIMMDSRQPAGGFPVTVLP
jgi:DNA-binding NarL/FixJ family response regulator